MVLEGASGPLTDPYDDGSLSSDTPPSDADPYNSSSSSAYSIDFNALHIPTSGFTSVTGYTSARFEQIVASTSKQLKRQLSPQETQALASAYSTASRYASQGFGLGLLAGWARCYQKAGTFQWPWGKAPEIKNPDILGPLRGQTARMGWHAMRAIPYGMMGSILLGTFNQSFASTWFMVTIARDPALGLMNKQLTDSHKQANGQIMSPGKPNSDYGSVKEEADVPYDDMSPQVGTDGALLSDSEMRMEEIRQQQQEDARRPRPVADRITMREERKDWDQSWGAKAGDSDPRAGKPVNDPMYGMSAAEKQAASGTAKESTWERLRREAIEKANK